MNGFLEFPETIKTTTLRSHTACTFMVMGLANEDKERLSKFLGHSMEVHR